MGILKQDYNKFRLYFEHSTKPSKDLSLKCKNTTTSASCG